MCSGYHLEDSKALQGIARAAQQHPLKDRIVSKLARPIITTGDVRVSDIVPVIAPDKKRREGHVFPMVWGFSSKLDSLLPLIDIDQLDMTRNPVLLEAWAKHRCLIPASWYYEWERVHPVISYDTFGDQTPEPERRRKLRKIPVPDIPDGSDTIGDHYMLQTKGSAITLLAGIYRIEDHDGVKIPHFMIITQYATPNIMFIHNKMPVIFDSSDAKLLRDWLDPEAAPPWDGERIYNTAIKDVIYEKSPVQRTRGTQPIHAGQFQ